MTLSKASGVWQACPDQHADLVVIGAGPAGITAAVYAASEGLEHAGARPPRPRRASGRLVDDRELHRFPRRALGDGIGDPAACCRCSSSARGWSCRSPSNAYHAMRPKPPTVFIKLHLDCGATIETRAVLIAAGVTWRKLEARGSDRFERAGVYYACTSVEALMYDKRRTWRWWAQAIPPDRPRCSSPNAAGSGRSTC